MKNIFIFCFLILAGAGCGPKGTDSQLISKNDRVAATEIGANFINSPSLNLAKLKGQVVVLDFWATWCGPCRMEIPSFVKLYPTYHAKGLEIVGLSIEEPNSQPVGYFDHFIKDFSITYPIGFADADTVKAYGIESIPATYFIDKTGKIATVFVGTHPESEITGVIEKLLAE